MSRITRRPSPFSAHRVSPNSRSVSGQNLFLRRFGAVITDFGLLITVAIASVLLVGENLLADFLSITAFFGVWLSLNLWKKASPGRALLQIEIHHNRPPKELALSLLLRFSLTWLPLMTVLIAGADPATELLVGALWLILFFWYSAILISFIATRGKRGIHDLICGTYGRRATSIPLSPLRLVGILYSSLLVASTLIWGLFDEGYAEALPGDDAMGQTTARTDRNYRADEISDMYRDRVFEVHATWERKGGWRRGGVIAEGSQGSGFLFVNNRHQGLIVSNWHVVAPNFENLTAYECLIRRDSNEEFVQGEIVAKGVGDLDLALILVNLSNWSPAAAPIAPVQVLRQGEGTVAMGNAFGGGTSLTNGLLSMVEPNGYLRTSTPVSPGNSGGPLFINKGGSLAGVVVAQFIEEGAQNINFAIPAEWVLHDDTWEFLEVDSSRTRQLLRDARRRQP